MALLWEPRQTEHCLKRSLFFSCFLHPSFSSLPFHPSGIRTWNVWQRKSTRGSAPGCRGINLPSTWTLNPRKPGLRHHHAAARRLPSPHRRTQRLSLKQRPQLPFPALHLRLVGLLRTMFDASICQWERGWSIIRRYNRLLLQNCSQLAPICILKYYYYRRLVWILHTTISGQCLGSYLDEKLGMCCYYFRVFTLLYNASWGNCCCDFALYQ